MMITFWADIKAESKFHNRTCQISVKVCTFIIVWLWQSWRQQWNCLCLTRFFFFFKSLWACQFSRLLKTNAWETEIEFLKIGRETDSFRLMQKNSSISAFFFFLYFFRGVNSPVLIIGITDIKLRFSLRSCSPSARGEAVKLKVA